MYLEGFRGDRLELKWNKKDILSLEAVLPLVKDRRACVQAGGCLGVFAKRLSSEFKTVYVFEPSTQFIDMTINAQEKNIIRFQAALGNEAAMVKAVCVLRGNDGKSTLHSGMTHVEIGGTIPTIALDWLKLPYCDLIYLDVEGWEYYAIRGALETIERCRPVIVCEINRGIDYVGIERDALRDLIKGAGYEFQSQHRSDEVYVPCKK